MIKTNPDSNRVQFSSKDPLNYGRTRIVLNYEEVTEENFLEVFEKAKAIHQTNKNDCEYLIGMFLGKQDILNRPAPNTSNINNTTVVNHAFPITRQIVGYTFGNPIELIQKNTDKQKQVQKVNDIFNYEGVFATDICTAIYASICGLGYQITLPSPDINKDNTPEIPITIDYLDPRNTFVVQSTSVGNPQIMSCMELHDTNNNHIKYICFTNNYKFTINNYNEGDQNISVEKNIIGLDPITMFENSLFLTGDWEQAISVMDALNQLTSDSLNDIEGTIKSLLVLIGCELDDDEATLTKIKDKRLLSIAGGTESVSGNLDAKFISPKLDSNNVKEIRESLEDSIKVITGIPDRSANSSGGDTGEAVLNRDGWTDIEIVAKLKEMFFKKAKTKQIAVALKILKQLNIIENDLSALDIEPRIGRHTTDNLGTKTTAFSTLVATGELATIDCLEMSGLTTRANEVVERGEKAKEERQQQALEYQKEQHDISLTNEERSNAAKVNDTKVDAQEKNNSEKVK